jgi:PAS domain S-box-containing protein
MINPYLPTSKLISIINSWAMGKDLIFPQLHYQFFSVNYSVLFCSLLRVPSFHGKIEKYQWKKPKMNRIKFNDIFLFILGVTAYVLSARLGLLAATYDNTSPVWPASGIGLGILVVLGPNKWPIVFIGAFIANLMLPTPPWISIGIACGNLSEALLSYLIVNRIYFINGKPISQRKPLAFILGAVFPAISSATIGVISLKLGGSLKDVPFENAWITWWVGDALGLLALAPLFFLKHEPSKKEKNYFLLFLTTIILAASCVAIFFYNKTPTLIYFLYPILLFVAFKFGTKEISFATILICAVSILATYMGLGPFSIGNLNYNLITLQLFLASVTVTSLILSSFKFSGSLKLPAIVLVTCWILTAFITYSFKKSEEKESRTEFNNMVQRATNSIQERFNIYENALWSGVGLVRASESITDEEWNSYIQTLNIIERYPGIQGIGIIVPVPKNKTSEFIQKQKKINGPNVISNIAGTNDRFYKNSDHDHFVITHLFPENSSKTVKGYDIASEQNRRQAADEAKRTGKAIITKHITLINDDNKKPAFLFFLPYYKKLKTPKNDIEREKDFAGLIYAPVVFENFIKNALVNSMNGLQVHVFEGVGIDRNSLVYQSTSDKGAIPYFEQMTSLTLGEREIKFGWNRSVEFVSLQGTMAAWLSLAGTIFSVLIGSLVVGFQNIYREAEDIAAEKTQLLTESENNIRLLNKDLEDRIHQRTSALETAYSELLRSESSFRELADSMPQMVWIANREGVAEYYNERWYTFIGINKDEDPYAKTSQLTHPDDKERNARLWEDSLQHMLPFEDQLRLWDHKSNEYRWHLSRAIPVFDENGDIKKWYGTSTDIHQRKILEDEQQKLISLVENSPDCTVLFNFDNELVYINRAGEEMLGLRSPAGHLMSKIFMEPAFLDEKILPTILAEGNWEGEVELLNADKEHLVITHSHAFIIKDRSTKESLIMALVARDVSELKSAEMEKAYLQGRERSAIEASRIKSEFLANMSHEIRTPINGIIGMTTLLTHTNLNHAQHELVDSLQHAGSTLLSVVNDILDFSKIEAGKLDFEIIDFDFLDLIKRARQNFEHEEQTKKIKLKTQVSSSVPKVLKGDPFRIKQILTNLLSNAFKFSNHGDIILSCDVKSMNDNTVRLIFSVKDQGIGLSAENIEKLFQPFSQADSSTRRRFGGTGLGLSICKHLVERMNGTIGVVSELGSGSTFWFEIDLIESLDQSSSHNNMQKQEEQNLSDIEGLHILVAEDNIINQKVISLMLKDMGASTVIVENGEDAITALEKEEFDLILMDCQMPILDGYEATAIIRKSKSVTNPNIPIIAVTANVLQGEKEKCQTAGMNDYLAKPMTMRDLSATIRKWIIGKTFSNNSDTFKDIDPSGSLFAELIELYKKSVPANLEKMEKAFAQDDLMAFGFEIHKLKSSSLNLGFKSVGHKCEQIELSIEQKDFVTLRELYPLLLSEIEKVFNRIGKT